MIEHQTIKTNEYYLSHSELTLLKVISRNGSAWAGLVLECLVPGTKILSVGNSTIFDLTCIIFEGGDLWGLNPSTDPLYHFLMSLEFQN